MSPGERARPRPMALVALVVLSAACRQDMHDQPRYRPLRPSDFFADGTSARPLVAGTVPRESAADEVPVDASGAFPLPLTLAVLQRGQQRFDIFCSPCHGRLGDGHGMIVRRGYQQPPSFHGERLRREPYSHFFKAMTEGYGAMPSYAQQVRPRDRWAIIAYIRALQDSQRATLADVPAAERERLQAERGRQ